MRRATLLVVAALLLALGAAVGRILSPAAAPARVDAASNPTAKTASAVSAAGIDAATTHAYQVASKSVVYVQNVGVGTGSGILYDTQGDIVTNDHVVSGGKTFSVTLSNGKTYSATLRGTDAADDLAVIHINVSGLTPATFARAGSYSVAQSVLAIGSPLGLQNSVTLGVISGLNRVEQEPNGAYLPSAIQTSAPINPGNSGGALVTLGGVVVGMPTLEQTGTSDGTSAQNVGFAIPSQRIVYIADQIISSGKVQNTNRPYLGISPTDPGSAGNSGGFGQGGFGFGQGGFGFGQGGYGQGSTATPVAGAVVAQVSSSGPAAKAGVQQGDTITAVNGTTISDAQGLLNILSQHHPGDTLTLKINRNGSTQTAKVTLGTLPA